MFSIIRKFASGLFAGQTVSGSVSTVVSTGTMLYLAVQVFKEEISLGSFAALEFVGLVDKVAKLPKQIYTPVTKEFDRQGAIFSGGELQRLAIARAYAKNAPVFILEEPSSALDPIAEAEIIDMMFGMGKEKTLIPTAAASTADQEQNAEITADVQPRAAAYYVTTANVHLRATPNGTSLGIVEAGVRVV